MDVSTLKNLISGCLYYLHFTEKRLYSESLPEMPSQVDLNKLGFDEHEKSEYLMGVKKPNGIVLISGPTGSGKTTTLYATLKILNQEKTNIVTVEDPIEYTLMGINQVQLKEKHWIDLLICLKIILKTRSRHYYAR